MIDVVSQVGQATKQTADTINNAVGKAASSVSNAASFLNNNVAALITPPRTPGINGWVFDVKKTESVELDADITDHYMEDNTYLNDHIVRKPIIITLSGYIGELVATKPFFVNEILKFMAQSLVSISEFTGDYTDQVTQNILDIINQVQSYITTVNQAIEKTKNIIKQFKSPGIVETAQEEAYNDLYNFFLSTDLLTVQTPFSYFENMKIIKISMSQGEDSVDYSDISITLKQMRFSKLGFTKFDSPLFQNRNNMQKGTMLDQGKLFGNDTSFLFNILG
jgi:hypothetical protein